jgi:AraC-like DNA-binding protein
MEHKFYINSQKGYADMLRQYATMHEQIGAIRNSANNQNSRGVIYDIKPEYGKGSIKVYTLMGNVMLFIFDIVFYEDLITIFDLTQEYFEIEYCVDGCIYIHEDNSGKKCFGPNNLSISMSCETRGFVRRCAGQKYQGISITAEKTAVSSYFGSLGIEIWEDTIEQLENQLRSQYYLGISTSPEIANTFHQIYNCRLPEKSKVLFLESKVMEIMSKIVSNEVLGTDATEQVSLAEFEINQIKKIPEILMSNMYELPTVNTLAKNLAMNSKKLAKGFKMIYGDTIFSYHRKLCLQRASSLLLDTDKSVSEIAYDIGYSNPSNFCYAFKKEYGITPLQYRASSLL